jgi:PTH1 family peptidyl-tRNA hydrolase
MDSYYIIVGLGNPGGKYEGTRHNVGFKVIDELADRFKIDRPSRFGKSMIGKGVIAGEKVILVKPMTYMNLSGEAVREICSFYKVDHHDHLIVISDDIDLPVGHLRIRKKGSAGGHNGLKNITEMLGDNQYVRLRFGVGGDFPKGHQVDYVLGNFSDEENKLMPERLKLFGDAILSFVSIGTDRTMNSYNGK